MHCSSMRAVYCPFLQYIWIFLIQIAGRTLRFTARTAGRRGQQAFVLPDRLPDWQVHSPGGGGGASRRWLFESLAVLIVRRGNRRASSSLSKGIPVAFGSVSGWLVPRRAGGGLDGLASGARRLHWKTESPDCISPVASASRVWVPDHAGNCRRQVFSRTYRRAPWDVVCSGRSVLQ